DADPTTAAMAWRNLASYNLVIGNCERCEQAAERSMMIGRQAGLAKMVSVGLSFYVWSGALGPRPAGNVVGRCKKLLDTDAPLVDQLHLVGALAYVYAMMGCDVDARGCLDRSADIQERRGADATLYTEHMIGPTLAMLGDLAEAERWFRAANEHLREDGHLGVLSTTAAHLGHVLVSRRVGLEDADQLCRESERLTDP